MSKSQLCVAHFVIYLAKLEPAQTLLFTGNSFSHTRLVLIWTAAIGIHTTLTHTRTHMYSYSYSCQCECVLMAILPIRPLSGTSSFSNDTVRFTRFLFTKAIAYKSFLFWRIKIWIDKDFPLLVFLCITQKPKNLHLSLRLLCLKTAAKHTAIVANVNKCAKTTSGSQRHCVT